MDSFAFNQEDSNQHLMIRNDDGLDNLQNFGTGYQNNQFSKTNLGFQITPRTHRNATIMNMTG